jgi:cell division transport system ATP-binding protein
MANYIAFARASKYVKINQMIFFDRVSKIYPDSSVALENVTFSIEPKEFISIVGPSGAGKTTLLKLFLAEERPSDGNIFYESIDVHSLDRGAINDFRRRVGMVFQDFRLLGDRTVYENIAFTMEVAGRTDEEIESDVPYVLDLVDLSPKIWNFPHELSGGEKQRVAIARALVNQPEVIIADEPTGNLDPVNTYDVVQILRKINDLGTTVILTTHNKGIIDLLGRRVVAMDRGRVVRDDKEGKYFV